jgi:hypothetical protein
MEFRSYYKLPVPQTTQENCVAHNGSLLPVPGRDILVQAWYQGGISLMDFTDSANPVEIAFFDRGPIGATSLVLGGFWSGYWYNGNIYGSEIAGGFDVFRALPSEHVSEAEVAAAGEVQLPQFNAQHQTRFTWEPSFAVARARFDQLVRTCTSTVSGQHSGPLLVSGVTCLDGATVSGPLTVQRGGSLLALDSVISGPVTATDATAVHLYHSTVEGPARITRATGSVAVVDTTVAGPLVLRGQHDGWRRADRGRQHHQRAADLHQQHAGADQPRSREHGHRSGNRSVCGARLRSRPVTEASPVAPPCA